MFCVHGAQRGFAEQAECTQNKTENAALAAATGNRKGAVAPLQCQGVWGRNAPSTLNPKPCAAALEKRKGQFLGKTIKGILLNRRGGYHSFEDFE